MATEIHGNPPSQGHQSSGGHKGGRDNHQNSYHNNNYKLNQRGFVGPFKLHMWIPTEEVGIVIGKSGNNVKKIVVETSAQVVIAKDLDPNLNESSNEFWTRVTLVGLAEHTFSACRVIRKTVTDVDGIVGEFKMRKWGHYIILGKGHDTIKRLSADHQVRIYVPDQRKEPENSKIQLEGEFTSVEKVYKSIVEEVTKQSSKQSANEKKLEKAAARESKKRTSKRVDIELTITPEDFEKLSAREDFNWTKLHRMVKTAFHVTARNKDDTVKGGTSDSSKVTALSVEGSSTDISDSPAPSTLVPTSVAEKTSQVFVLSGEETNVENAIKTINELIEDETKNPRDMFLEAKRANKIEKYKSQKQYKTQKQQNSGASSEGKGKGKGKSGKKGGITKSSRRKQRATDADDTSHESNHDTKQHSSRKGKGRGKGKGDGKGRGRGEGSGRGGGRGGVYKPKSKGGISNDTS